MNKEQMIILMMNHLDNCNEMLLDSFIEEGASKEEAKHMMQGALTQAFQTREGYKYGTNARFDLCLTILDLVETLADYNAY